MFWEGGEARIGEGDYTIRALDKVGGGGGERERQRCVRNESALDLLSLCFSSFFLV